ncbi:hypothetical protein QJU23_00745 [Pasteurella atlantica]|uniref:Uncharacterized protein n=2 Tax=Pasteurellaceae TaxID=712 RepID=A0ACC6HJ99_9PAST|nr:hypothetical protein [Pasteurella atlantica]MDP8050952.1 hypothetical protein [Pasteurella atlantica]MDP8104221.1 hypothetical protein [Pasteurella atlantica]MDP8147608.1 hypothetical protein [Pasteurella atlantica]
MKISNFERIQPFSKNHFSLGYELSKVESILYKDILEEYTDINDILELYTVKKYIDNEVHLKKWTQTDLIVFKEKVEEYGNIIGKFISTINNDNVIEYIDNLEFQYVKLFWEVISNFNCFKKISKVTFNKILDCKPHSIQSILKNEKLVEYYSNELKFFLIDYEYSAEIILSIYEKDNSSNLYLPKSLTLSDKEHIILKYLSNENFNVINLNYIALIKDIKNNDFLKTSDKTKLIAKRLYEEKITEYFTFNQSVERATYVGFSKDMDKIKDIKIDGNTTSFFYNLDYIINNNESYALFKNFKYLFEYIDEKNRITLVSKPNKMSTFERMMNETSKYHYLKGFAFDSFETISLLQIRGYTEILIKKLNISLEEIIHRIFTKVFQERYDFSANTSFNIPSTQSYLEKIRILAPEFESILKQFKLFVEDSDIDLELLQISSKPVHFSEIPSLNHYKYIYLNNDNPTLENILTLFFSDQTLLYYVEPYKDKNYRTFWDLLVNEEVLFNNFEDYQKDKLNFLIEKELIFIDENKFIRFSNLTRLHILKDLYDNEVGSYYHYPAEFQQEVKIMIDEDLIYFEGSLLSIPEQKYFNYYLNKSEFVNGLDLRNRYVHGTQANANKGDEHERAYLTYLKLLILVLLKIDDDLNIFALRKKKFNFINKKY